MGRILALSLTSFSVDRVRRRARGSRAPAALLLVAAVRGAEWVAGCCEEAARRGVSAGMRLAHARALLGEGVDVEPFDPAGDARDLERLGRWAMRFTPRVALHPPCGLLLDATGCERLYGGETELARAAVGALETLGFRARGAVADTVGCAWALAHHGDRPCACVPPGEEARALAPLPVESLRLDPEAVDALMEVGVERVEHLFELPREGLPSRFGAELCLRLDQALGAAFEPLGPLGYVAPLAVERDFESPVELEVVRHTLRRLTAELAAELRERGEGALRVELVLACAEAPAAREVVHLSRPSRDAAHLGSLLHPRLERCQLGFGVERIALAATVTAPLEARQESRWEAPADSAEEALGRAMGELVDALVGRLGGGSVLAVEPVETHLPERAFAVRSVLDRAPLRSGAPAVTRLPRPTHLFEPPEPVDVGAGSDGLPRELRWRGEARRVVRCFGPERIGPQWWSAAGWPAAAAGAVRDYFRVEDDRGRWLWVGRSGGGRWFLHGEWR